MLCDECVDFKDKVNQKNKLFDKIQFVLDILDLIREYDCFADVYWDKKYNFYIECNDLFHWATTDEIKITKDNFELLKTSLKDAKETSVNGEMWGTSLFCCRVKKMRPQGKYYTHIDENLWELFDYCGPERAITIFNPYSKPKKAADNE